MRRIAIRPLSVQFPSSAQLPELGQASLAVPLVRVTLAKRASSQAHPFQGDGCLTSYSIEIQPDTSATSDTSDTNYNYIQHFRMITS